MALEREGVFFSNPVDLDLLMLEAFPVAYGVQSRNSPDKEVIVSVLGKSHVNTRFLGDEVLSLFEHYHANFNLKSKPATHLHALSRLSDEELVEGLPPVFQRMVNDIKARLEAIPE